MHVLEAIQKRRSVRDFLEKDVEDKYVGVLLYAASLAPCAGNVQEWRFIVVKDKQKKHELAKASYEQMWMEKAPIIIAICTDEKEIENEYGERGKKMYMYLDCALAAENLLLAAESLGLAGCIVAAFDDEKVSRILNLPINVKPIMLIPIGYPKEKPEMPYKKPLESIVYFNEYGKKEGIKLF
ncbi:MAG: nitroreductase family protein [Candidatus Aenigmatarchaeota archaeon]